MLWLNKNLDITYLKQCHVSKPMRQSMDNKLLTVVLRSSAVVSITLKLCMLYMNYSKIRTYYSVH